jgi:hypothetical protein
MNSVAEMEKRYPVEVSGWDADETFFVEKTVLEWKEGGIKTTTSLHCAIRVGCVLFIRLLQTASIGSNFPIPYEAASIAETGANGSMQISLVQLQPRVSSRGETHRESSSATKVA